MIDSTDLTEIIEKHKLLESHRVFGAIKNIENLGLFMECHVFAVWDFMCLVKRLQREFTSIESLWIPSDAPMVTRLINEIVLGEESDEAPGRTYISHFELYLLAMKEVGADTRQIEKFIDQIRKNNPASEALQNASVHSFVQKFVNNTLNTVINGNVYQVLGSFFYGREHVIPNMFKGLLDNWHIDEKDAPMFVYYLKRHIELDSDEHGPAAQKIIENLTKDDPSSLRQLCDSAVDAIDHRILLWDGVMHEISRQESA